MKRSILIAAFISVTSASVFAQHDHSSHQKQAETAKAQTNNGTIEGTQGQQLSRLLSTYYNIKNALVTGDAASASANALAFVKTVNSIDYKVISEGNIHTLAGDAGKIANTKDLNKQRQYFAGFSSNMASVAKAVKLTGDAVYQQYCPMKKAVWLSSEKAIKNPYYGSSMLSCGEVSETIQ